MKDSMAKFVQEDNQTRN